MATSSGGENFTGVVSFDTTTSGVQYTVPASTYARAQIQHLGAGSGSIRVRTNTGTIIYEVAATGSDQDLTTLSVGEPIMMDTGYDIQVNGTLDGAAFITEFSKP